MFYDAMSVCRAGRSWVWSIQIPVYQSAWTWPSRVCARLQSMWWNSSVPRWIWRISLSRRISNRCIGSCIYFYLMDRVQYLFATERFILSTVSIMVDSSHDEIFYEFIVSWLQRRTVDLKYMIDFVTIHLRSLQKLKDFRHYTAYWNFVQVLLLVIYLFNKQWPVFECNDLFKVLLYQNSELPGTISSGYCDTVNSEYLIYIYISIYNLC